MIDYKVISSHRHLLGETPIWDKSNHILYWADSLDMKIYAYHEKTEILPHFQLNETIGSMALAHNNHLIVALRSGIYLFNVHTEKLTHIVTPEGEPMPNNRFNDGKTAPNGDFFVGTMDETFTENIGKLYHISQEGIATLVKKGFMVSNGLAWSEDGTKMYHACSRMQKIWVYDFTSTPPFISNERVFAEIPEETGRPDGGATDIDGSYWSAGVSTGHLNQFDAKGHLIQQIALPMKSPTMPCFGGSDNSTLFITSLSHHHTAQDFEQYPLSGGVIAIQTHTKGVNVPRYLFNKKEFYDDG